MCLLTNCLFNDHFVRYSVEERKRSVFWNDQRKQKKMAKGKDSYVFHVLGGPTYSEEERPQRWHNELPLLCDDYRRGNPPDMQQLPLHQFPLIEDFQVILELITPTGCATSCKQVGKRKKRKMTASKPGSLTLLVSEDGEMIQQRKSLDKEKRVCYSVDG